MYYQVIIVPPSSMCNTAAPHKQHCSYSVAACITAASLCFISYCAATMIRSGHGKLAAPLIDPHCTVEHCEVCKAGTCCFAPIDLTVGVVMIL